MSEDTVVVLFTCYNRKEKTCGCVRSLVEGNPDLRFQFVVLDDNSSDGTKEAIDEMKQQGLAIEVLHGDGKSFWAGGMRQAIAYAKKHTDAAWYLLVNDDVSFFPGAIETMQKELGATQSGTKAALVGAMCDEKGAFSYGGIRYTKGIHYEEVRPEDENRCCDSFNMNCLLMTRDAFFTMPNFDSHYVHSLADFDYGLEMRRKGIPVQVSASYAGICPDNDPAGGWTDQSLSRRERLRQKESVKGAPFRPWFYFLKKNFGLGQAVLHGFTPFVRILLGR